MALTGVGRSAAYPVWAFLVVVGLPIATSTWPPHARRARWMTHPVRWRGVEQVEKRTRDKGRAQGGQCLARCGRKAYDEGRKLAAMIMFARGRKERGRSAMSMVMDGWWW